MSPRARFTALRIALGCLIAAGLCLQIRQTSFPFRWQNLRSNWKLLRNHRNAPPPSQYQERALDESLADWGFDGSIRLALPPQYSNSPFGNAGFVMSFINHGDVILYNGPYPHPKIAIDERVEGAPPAGGAYHFENRSSNAALFIALDHGTWPIGYTAWYDLVFRKRQIWMESPKLVDEEGQPIKPTRVRAVHPLNVAILDEGGNTYLELQHLSPIVWVFPRAGRLADHRPGLLMAEDVDGAEVSWMPPVPTSSDHPFGMFTLAPVIPAGKREAAPEWWRTDEKLRRAIVDGAPSQQRLELLAELTRQFPNDPLLPHYRVVARLGTDGFDGAWLAAQEARCDLATWYLVAWSHVSWSRTRQLPCLKELQDGKPLDMQGSYVAESVVFAYRDLREDAQLQVLAKRAVQTSFLQTDFRAFSHPPNDFAWLWLHGAP